MKPSSSRQGRQKIFVWVVLGCIALAVGYTSWVILRNGSGAASVLAQGQGTPLPIAAPDELAAIQNQPHLLFLHQEVAPYGQVTLTSLDPASPGRAQSALSCGRIHYAAGNGICLMYEDTSAQDPLATPRVRVMLFGSDFQPRYEFPIDGVLSRARVSPDGKYAAFTV